MKTISGWVNSLPPNPVADIFLIVAVALVFFSQTFDHLSFLAWLSIPAASSSGGFRVVAKIKKKDVYL